MSKTAGWTRWCAGEMNVKNFNFKLRIQGLNHEKCCGAWVNLHVHQQNLSNAVPLDQLPTLPPSSRLLSLERKWKKFTWRQWWGKMPFFPFSFLTHFIVKRRQTIEEKARLLSSKTRRIFNFTHSYSSCHRCLPSTIKRIMRRQKLIFPHLICSCLPHGSSFNLEITESWTHFLSK